MKNDFIITQIKETITTREKTVTVTQERLEKVDCIGRKFLVAKRNSTDVDYHDLPIESREGD